MSTYNPTLATLDQSTDAGYRAWVTEFLNALTNGNWSLGGSAFPTFQQTTDTGQYASGSIATATRPAVNTATGFLMMKFTDTNAAACPIFVKFEFGSGSATTNPSIWVTVGSSTDGAGNMTGTLMLARTQYMTSPANITITRPTYSSAGDGYFGLVFKYQGWLTANSFFIFISRGFDETTGLATADGYTFGISLANSQVVANHVNANAGSPIASGTNGHGDFCTVPASILSSDVSGVSQAFKWYGAFPRVQNLLPFCTVVTSEIPTQTTFTATLSGSTSHTYLSLTLGGNQWPLYNNITGFNVGMIWE